MSCKDCPVGHGCPIDGLDAPSMCTNGTYQNETKQTECLTCPVGYMCKNIDVAPIPCADGLYSAAGVTGCTVCPSGHRYFSVIFIEMIIQFQCLIMLV